MKRRLAKLVVFLLGAIVNVVVACVRSVAGVARLIDNGAMSDNALGRSFRSS